MMEKVTRTGRPRDEEYWGRVTLLEGGRRVKCNDCGWEFAASANRIKAHIDKVKGKGIRVCNAKANSNNHLERSQGQIQADDAEDQERIQIRSSFVSNGENLDLLVRQYVFECLRSEDRVFVSPLSYLTQEEFITLKPETHLDSLVIDIFVEILTDIGRKKKSVPSNWYLPVTFSDAALKGKVGHFLNFVHCQKMKENYMSDPKSCEKIFIPVHFGARPNGGHFYLYIIHLKTKEIEIWDSLPITSVGEIERDETTKKLLLAMEKLFEKVTFTKFHSKMAKDILLQANGFDCGIFVINYMEQSDNYVKRSSRFQFDSKKEREDLALKLLTNDLNQEKQNLYAKARRHYVQVEKQDDNKRLKPDEDYSEDVGSELETEYDDSDEEDDGLENGSFKGYQLPKKDSIGRCFQRYTEQLWKWIMDDKVSAIGIWGIGGSGKTALATYIYGKLLEEADIKVIWVTVSQNRIYKLQKVIARSIKLDISDEFEDKRIAKKLLQAFKDIKKCVVILDDVWDHFFLKEVGFPVSDNQIKLILTTRIWEVCQGMGCEKNMIKVKLLNHEESWALFKKTGGFYKGLSLEVKEIAWDMTDECEGLPLAIVRIATSMKGKEQIREWSDMLECLENLGNGQYEMDKWVFPVLKSSYDFLNNKLRRFFLYCALNTDGYFDDERANQLIRRFVYESIDETKKLRVQYNEGYRMLNKLINHSMLERHDKCYYIHKYLRALAIGIAEDTSKIMANDCKSLTKAPSDDQWKEDLQKVFLRKNEIKTIPDGTYPRFFQLSTLLLDCNERLTFISDDFFINMPVLKTLDLSKTGIESLPKSVSNLKFLIALLLSGCSKLSNIPSLEKLKQLISLDLSFTAITKEPVGLESLINLRHLNLHHTDKLVMSAWVISKLINLEHLELTVTAAGIQGLYNLEVIVAYFHDISVFNTCVSFLDENCKLKSFDLTLQGAICYSYHEETNREAICDSYHEETNRERSMKRMIFVGMDLGNTGVVLPGDIKDLFIEDCHQRTGVRDLCSALSHGHNNNRHQIERLDIRRFEDVQYLCCFSGSCPFCSSSQLVGRLSLSGLVDLKDLVSPYGLPPLHQSSLFSHLKDLSIEKCNSMETLMTPQLLAHLQNLRTISIGCCWKMKEIVGEDHSEMELSANADLIALPKLTSLKLTDLYDLKYLVSPNALLSFHQSSLFSHLTYLSISGCESMETLMTPKLLAHLQNLRTITVVSCGKMKEIVGEDHSEMELTACADLIALPKLTSLKLFNMPQLNFVFRGVMLCRSLQTFSAESCDQLKSPLIGISLGCVLPMKKTSTGYQWKK